MCVSLQGGKSRGDIGVKGAWIHSSIKPSAKDKELKADHLFGVSKSNKDKMARTTCLFVSSLTAATQVVLSAPTADVKAEWIKAMIACGGVDVEAAGAESKINPASVKEGYVLLERDGRASLILDFLPATCSSCPRLATTGRSAILC